jgi:hypothetical protein
MNAVHRQSWGNQRVTAVGSNVQFRPQFDGGIAVVEIRRLEIEARTVGRRPSHANQCQLAASPFKLFQAGLALVAVDIQAEKPDLWPVTMAGLVSRPTENQT